MQRCDLPWKERRSVISAVVSFPLILLFLHLYFGNGAANRVDRSPYHSENATNASTQKILVGTPDILAQHFAVRERKVEIVRLWIEHSYSHVRTGTYSTERVVDRDLYVQIEFRGTVLMQEHVRRPFRFLVDGQPARLMLTNDGSFLRAKTTGHRARFVVEGFDGVIRAFKEEIDVTDRKAAQLGATDNPDGA